MDKGIKGVTALGFGLNEYIKMFSLSENELNMNILDCRAGASCFAADMHERHKKVHACDPLYQLPVNEIKQIVDQAGNTVKTALDQNSEQFCVLPEKANEFIQIIDRGTHRFFQDLPLGLQESRYTSDSLPTLSFTNEQFELALVCHYLFTFSDQLSLDYHVQAIKELVRIANEVRIFPLVTTSGHLSPFVGEVVAQLQMQSFGVEIRGVDYMLQNQGNAMLRVWAPECHLSLHESSKS